MRLTRLAPLVVVGLLAITCWGQERPGDGSRPAPPPPPGPGHNFRPPPGSPRPPLGPPGAPADTLPAGRPVRPPPLEPLLRMVGERRPELADRLRRLGHESPEQLHEVVLNALFFRLEEELEAAEQAPRPPRAPRDRMPADQGPEPELRALHERHEALEKQTRGMSEQLRQTEPGAERTAQLDRLRGLVTEQFEVRTALRQAELDRIRREVGHLQTMVEKMQRELAERTREREAIIQKRIDQMLGAEPGGW